LARAGVGSRRLAPIAKDPKHVLFYSLSLVAHCNFDSLLLGQHGPWTHIKCDSLLPAMLTL
jgi:hypothetical protein